MIYLSFYGKIIKIQYSLLWLINDKPYFKGDVLKLKTIKQKYAVFAPLLVLFSDLIAYYGTKLINRDMVHHMLPISLDYKIPFIEPFIIVYVLAFIQWAAAYIIISFEDKEKAYRYAVAATIANIVCAVVFIVFPTDITSLRPAASGVGLTGKLTKLIFSADTPAQNLFPSMHCLESWLCIRVVFDSRKIPTVLKWVNLLFSISVFMSVVFLKQHYLVDIPAGILTAEISYFIARKLKLGEKLSKL